MVTVEIMLSTNFCAVPALSRVEPAKISGPVSTSIAKSEYFAISELGLHVRATVRAPIFCAYSNAPIA